MIAEALRATGNNEWGTPKWLFDGLNAVYDFTLDAAASDSLHMCGKYYTAETDGTSMSWEGERVWLNPPYSIRLKNAFLDKCAEEAMRGTSIALLMAARTDIKRFHECILGTSAKVVFIQGRLKFVGASEWAPFPSMLAFWNFPIAPAAVRACRRNGASEGEIIWKSE